MAGTPSVLERLLKDVAAGDPRWDFRPDPERFTLREVLAHLVDWEPIWLERMKRIRDETNPFLASIDEGELAITHNYGQKDPLDSLAKYGTGRAALVKCLTEMAEDDWDRPCDREFVGPLTMQTLATLILSHDGYHLAQVVEWLKGA